MPIYSYSPQLFTVNHLLPSNHKETQPFLHAVQRSADGSSNSRETTQPHTLNRTPTPPLYPHALNLTARTATSTSRLEKPAGKASVQQLRIPDSIPGTGVRSPPPPSSHEKKICYNTTTQTNYIQNPKKDKVNHK